MQKDEHAIRELIATWMDASIKGDLDTVLGLMDEDIIFMTPGAEPFDREIFKERSEQMKGTRMEGTVETHELRVLGDWAYARNYLDLTFFPPHGGAGMKRQGFTLSIYRKDSHGNWLLHRDANLIPPAPK